MIHRMHPQFCRTLEELISYFQSIPAGASELDLGNNYCVEVELSPIFQVLLASIGIFAVAICAISDHYNYDYNDGCYQNDQAWQLGCISMGTFTVVTGFFLTYSIYKQNGDIISRVNNALTNLAIAFTNIPVSLSSIDLSENELGMRAAAPVATLFAAIPKHITSLNLSGNKLQNFSIESLESLEGTLPNIKTIRLSLDEINLMTSQQLRLLKNIFPLINPLRDIILVSKDGRDNFASLPLTTLRHLGALKYSGAIFSLQDRCAFFIADRLWENRAVARDLDIPPPLQEFVASL